MGQWDVRLLSATYKKLESDQLAVDMYGTTEDGRSIVARYVGFEPYLEVVEPTKEVLDGIEERPRCTQGRGSRAFL